MSDLSGQTTKQLFDRWRSGDPEAGNAMAQRFSDWYYAIAASRLGDAKGQGPLARACERFASGVVNVEDARKLDRWAHDIISEELTGAGSRIRSGDHGNKLTKNRKPSELLAQARDALPAQQVELLSHAYNADYDIKAVEKEAEAAGGYPLAVLDARYALKRWLRDEAKVGFTQIPEKPNLDWKPLPLYEGGRLTEGNHERSFELWMLSDLTLCGDIAEFAAFALALRGGAFEQPAAEAPKPKSMKETPLPTKAEPVQVATPDEGGSKLPLIIGVLVVLAILGAVAAFALG